MKLKKEDVYINLKGKSKEELTDLYNFLERVGEKQYRKDLMSFLSKTEDYETYNFIDSWTLGWYINSKNKTEVTIEQLKEIIKPNLQTQLENAKKELENAKKELENAKKELENAKKEVERIEKLIEEDNEPKLGDWCKLWDDDKPSACIGKLHYIDSGGRYGYHTFETHFKNCEKITNPELIKLLEDESK